MFRNLYHFVLSSFVENRVHNNYTWVILKKFHSLFRIIFVLANETEVKHAVSPKAEGSTRNNARSSHDSVLFDELYGRYRWGCHSNKIELGSRTIKKKYFGQWKQFRIPRELVNFKYTIGTYLKFDLSSHFCSEFCSRFKNPCSSIGIDWKLDFPNKQYPYGT